MGRGRAKAKQTKVARELKYSSPTTDYEALQRELSSTKDSGRDDSPAEQDSAEQDTSNEDSYEDKYADLYTDEGDEADRQ